MSKKEKTKIIIIIPAYNEEQNILKTVQGISKRYDYVVINDGSKDNTLQVLKDNKLNHVDLVYNLGIGGAVQTGYKYAYQNGYDVAIQFDGDGQHDSEFIEKLIEPIINGEVNFVIGSRYIKEQYSSFQSTWLRRFGKNILSFVIRFITGKTITDPTSGFRAADKSVIKLFKDSYATEYPEPQTVTMLLKSGYKVKEVSVEMHERIGGVSSIRTWKTVYYMINVILALFIGANRGGRK